MPALRDRDRIELDRRGIADETVQWQLSTLQGETRPADLDRSCSLGDGILVPTSELRTRALAEYERQRERGAFSKFVPASGAASRMFRSLKRIHTRDDILTLRDLVGEVAQRNDDALDTLELVAAMDRVALFDTVNPALLDRVTLGSADCSAPVHELLHAILTPEGLGYGESPKGLIPFHRYERERRTPVGEHLVEARELFADRNGRSVTWFTVPVGGEAAFNRELDRCGLDREQHTVHLDAQRASTDTLALDSSGELLRDTNGDLVFRPGGHGALLHNLNDLSVPYVSLKNIDNVAHQDWTEPSDSAQKLLLGLAAVYTSERDSIWRELQEDMATADVDQIRQRIRKVFGEDPVQTADDERDVPAALRRWLRRPLRVCGMVENTGEPGGGPYWVRGTDGRVTRQIVEKSQINLEDRQQAAILQGSTHFNPVLLVCSLQDSDGEPFDLTRFVDHDAAFVASKSYQGEDITALELPGLWNGSMADWITVFVEVPKEVFNPAKTVNDLLREAHQPRP